MANSANCENMKCLQKRGNKQTTRQLRCTFCRPVNVNYPMANSWVRHHKTPPTKITSTREKIQSITHKSGRIHRSVDPTSKQSLSPGNFRENPSNTYSLPGDPHAPPKGMFYLLE
ncbi:hypothetical protein JTE90_009607 [Oedothorax gibbosus]|uniref:Uncharacterized protein n=1 Tax=Oedothorax gibbosus TaxID=931172 RepID=A0AAV6TX99_9ARAC|nr:hypothetical protein JTE90_009607 [Oedothorax gibbosus]